MSIKDDFNRMVARRTADAALRQYEADKQARAEQMPTEKDAIRALFAAWQRLKDLGWREGQYMPSTGERYAGVQCGSTGIHAYTAEMRGPFDRMFTVYDGDIWPTRHPPVLFREWQDTDVQPNLRPAYPMPEEAPPKSLLRKPIKPGERLVCYCPPGICQAPKGFSGPCNRATDAPPSAASASSSETGQQENGNG
jgi:hypothetical protein